MCHPKVHRSFNNLEVLIIFSSFFFVGFCFVSCILSVESRVDFEGFIHLFDSTERATEKQLLLEHSTKLDKLNSQVLNTYEQLKNKISVSYS